MKLIDKLCLVSIGLGIGLLISGIYVKKHYTPIISVQEQEYKWALDFCGGSKDKILVLYFNYTLNSTVVCQDSRTSDIPKMEK